MKQPKPGKILVVFVPSVSDVYTISLTETRLPSTPPPWVTEVSSIPKAHTVVSHYDARQLRYPERYQRLLEKKKSSKHVRWSTGRSLWRVSDRPPLYLADLDVYVVRVYLLEFQDKGYIEARMNEIKAAAQALDLPEPHLEADKLESVED